MKIKELLLKENVGGFDLFIRSALGSLAIVALAMDWVPDSWKLLVALVAFVGLFSGMTRHCTPYSLLGISTKKE